MTPEELVNVLEAAMLAAGRALSLDDFLALFSGSVDAPDRGQLRKALAQLGDALDGRGIELVEVASGYRLQVRERYSPWLGGLFAERPPRYSRALLETLALIAYRQPITRGEIESVRGVAVSSNIIKTLMEREWIRVLGHREVPGRPALYGTTREFLDHFGLKNLEGLPALADIRDLDQVAPDLFAPASAENDKQQGEQQEGTQSEDASAEAEAVPEERVDAPPAVEPGAPSGEAQPSPASAESAAAAVDSDEQSRVVEQADAEDSDSNDSHSLGHSEPDTAAASVAADAGDDVATRSSAAVEAIDDDELHDEAVDADVAPDASLQLGGVERRVVGDSAASADRFDNDRADAPAADRPADAAGDHDVDHQLGHTPDAGDDNESPASGASAMPSASDANTGDAVQGDSNERR